MAAEAGAWNNLGIALNGASRYAEALAAYERALALFASLDDHNERGKALNGKGPALHGSGKPAEALLIHQEALAIQRAVGDLCEHAAVLNNLSLDHQELENYAEACATAEEAASLFQRLGDPTNEANALPRRLSRCKPRDGLRRHRLLANAPSRPAVPWGPRSLRRRFY
ncbi:tetratricopeptide repeat protein [Streptomyces mirabilis]|uniref:tetratricopeptide repeat protein n=1 Tax=Streptomyces mirabilis TaxID=68239 RepID=UPI0036C09DA8